jgi:two-component system, NarL family, response regulator
MNKEHAIRILIVDDHPVVRDGLAAMIERLDDMTVIGEAANGREALDLFRIHRPDVTLMDLRMPEMDGVEAIRAIRSEAPHARILVLTTYGGDEEIYRALQAGAQGYSLKDVGREEMLAAIRIVHAGGKHIPPAVAAKLAEQISRVELTSRELEVLGLMAEGKSNREIAAALFIVEGTVKTHVTNILLKLSAQDRTQAVTIALKRGILHLE